MSSHSYTHPGVERFERAVSAVSEATRPAALARTLPIVLLTGIVSAVVAAAIRWFGIRIDAGFALEWVVAWAIALIAVVVFARAAYATSGWFIRATRQYAAERRRRRQDEQLMDLAHHDPRVMAEIRAAQARAERVDEFESAALSS
jgi:fructose-specific phosphotransferase system IIC component